MIMYSRAVQTPLYVLFNYIVQSFPFPFLNMTCQEIYLLQPHHHSKHQGRPLYFCLHMLYVLMHIGEKGLFGSQGSLIPITNAISSSPGKVRKFLPIPKYVLLPLVHIFYLAFGLLLRALCSSIFLLYVLFTTTQEYIKAEG